MDIIRLVPTDSSDYFDQIAELHAAEIHHGLLPLLGKEFLSALYRSLCEINQAGVWIALHNNRILGFIAGCANTKNTMASVLSNFGGRLLVAAGRNILSIRLVSKILAVASYPFRHSYRIPASYSVPEAELLAISVKPESRGMGIGKQLVETLERELSNWGSIQSYHVKTNIDEVGSNAFYSMLGFELAGTVPHHDLQLQIYIKHVNFPH